MTEEPSNKKITLQDIIDEGKKPIKLKALDGTIDYIMPDSNDIEELQKKIDKDVILLREQHKIEYPSISISESNISEKKAIMLNDLVLWKGLNKADSSVTQTMVKELPSDVKSNLSLQLTLQQYDNMKDINQGDLKNLLQMTKGVASPF